MTKHKVLYLITKSTWGGAQRYVFDLATNIDKEHYEPVIAVGGTGELYDALRDAGLHTTSIPHLGRDVSLFKDVLALISIGRLIKREQPQVLHINSSKVGLLGGLLGRLLGVPNIIFTCHGWAFNEDRAGWQKTLLKFMQWLTVLLAHQTIAVSMAVRADMNWPWAQKKMHVIPLGRAAITFKPREDARGLVSMNVKGTETSLYEHREDVWIGTIAELHPTKCLHIAIAAMAQLVTTFPTLRYVIIHDGQERARLEKLVADYELTDHVFFTGTIIEAAALLNAFDIFLLPSRSEAFGYVLIEAGQAGLPVVASRVGGIPEIIADQTTGLLVPVGDADAITRAVSDLLENKEMMASYGQALQESVKKFSLKAMVDQTKKLYTSRE